MILPEARFLRRKRYDLVLHAKGALNHRWYVGLLSAMLPVSGEYRPDMASPVKNACSYPVGVLHQHDLTHAHV